MPSQANTSGSQFSTDAQTSDANGGSPRSSTLADVAVQTAGVDDQSRLVAAIVLAFSMDPAAR